MKGSISLVLLAIGFVAVSSMPFRDLFNDELRDLSFNRGNNDRYGDENVYGDESSRGSQIPYPNYRRNMCKALVHRAFKDYYNPINVNAINRFMTTVKRNTAQVTAETSSAVAAAESIQYGNRPIFQVMFDRIHAFESNTRVNLQNQIGRLMAGMGNGIGYILLDGVHGFDDSRKCSMMKDMFVKTFETYKEKNMNREGMAQAFRENTALHTALSNALMDDIKCLRQDVQNVVADFNNFVNVTAERPSRDVVMQIFGYLYDFSKFARHFREILCEGQIAAFKMMDSTEGTGSGNGQGGYEGYFYGQDGNQWYGYGQGGNQRYGNGQGRNQGYGNGQGRNQGYGNGQGRNQGYGNGQGRNQGYGNGQGRYQGHGNGQGGNQGYGYGQGGNQEYRYGQGSYQANGYGQGSNQYNGNGQDRYQGNGYRQAGNMLNMIMNAMNKR